MKYALFDTDGFPIAFYSKDFHGEAIPAVATEISDDQWAEFLEHPGSRRWLNGGVVEHEPPALEPLLPAPLTARQLRLGLVTNGIMLDHVESTIAAIDDQQARDIAKIEWEYASQFERSHPLIAQVGAALGLTDKAIDEMWIAALLS
ncbi:hypothetical protein [Endobacterium cereale]|uniref:hypothetical protein n=1 Tax=Endobacterium cereale TaxID=2663029 RepID=UPI002B492CF4|nr:hypothetical protein [Endobacterium cereale]MEB2845940.1 hypothetical protein [Endobacterium cereale]